MGAQVTNQDKGILYEEQIIATGSGALTATGTPQDFFGQGTIGWIAEPGSDQWGTFTFVGSSATNVKLADGTTIQADGKYCIKYMKQTAYDEVIVPADIVPNEVTVILKGDLYKASKGNDVSTSSIIGHIEVEVPRFQLNGSMDIALNSSGASQIPFAGQALVTTDASAGCEGGGYYAIVKKFEEGAQWYDNLIAFAMEGSDTIELAPSATKAIRTYAVFANGSSRLIDPAKLTYTVSGNVGTVDGTTGVFTAAATAQTGTVAITVKGIPNPKPGVILSIGVTVAQ